MLRVLGVEDSLPAQFAIAGLNPAVAG